MNVLFIILVLFYLPQSRGCMECDVCLEGAYHYCKNMLCIGVNRDGGFANFCVIPSSLAHKLPENVGFSQGMKIKLELYYHIMFLA